MPLPCQTQPTPTPCLPPPTPPSLTSCPASVSAAAWQQFACIRCMHARSRGSCSSGAARQAHLIRPLHFISHLIITFLNVPRPADLSITDALALGDKLNAVLLYHVGPGALTPEQLAQCERPLWLLLRLLLAWLLLL